MVAEWQCVSSLHANNAELIRSQSIISNRNDYISTKYLFVSALAKRNTCKCWKRGGQNNTIMWLVSQHNNVIHLLLGPANSQSQYALKGPVKSSA